MQRRDYALIDQEGSTMKSKLSERLHAALDDNNRANFKTLKAILREEFAFPWQLTSVRWLQEGIFILLLF